MNIHHWYYSPVCKKTAKSGCVGKHFEFCDVHPDKAHMMNKECASCKNAREAEERRAREAAAAAEKAAKGGKKKNKKRSL